MDDDGGAPGQWLTLRARRDVHRRAAALRLQAVGAVLELGDDDDVAALHARAEAEERYDTVVSILRIAALPDLPASCRSLRSLVRPGGRLLFLEPSTGAGMMRRAQRVLAPVDHLLTGRLERRDVPAVLRAAGFQVTDCERVSLPMPWPWGTFVEGSAR